MQSTHFFHKHRLDLLIIGVLLLVTSCLVFYGFGNLSLHPWDEAWYATISRNLVRSREFLDMRYNTHPFWDHPPLGFYLTAASFMLFGVNEFAARAPQAMLGVAAVVLTYITGKQLKNKWVGLIAAIVVLSSRWFLFRSRSGNLDILLTFTQLQFFWLAVTTKSHRKIWLPALGLGIALLSKTTIASTMAPLLLWAWYERHLNKKITFRELAVAIGVFLIPILPWYAYNTIVYGLSFPTRTFFEVGLRKGSTQGVSFSSIKQTALYLHSAVHRWYSLMGLSTIAAGFLWVWHFFTKQLHKVRSLSWVLAYTFLTGFPFLLSAKTEIWHLIPLIPAFGLTLGLVSEHVASKIPRLGQALLLLITVFIAATSIKAYWSEFIHQPPAVSEAAQISKTIPHKDRKLFLTNDAFYPTVVYYADLKKETRVVKEYEFMEICSTSSKPFYYLTTQTFLDQTPGWTIVSSQGDLQLVEFNNLTCGVEKTNKGAT